MRYLDVRANPRQNGHPRGPSRCREIGIVVSCYGGLVIAKRKDRAEQSRSIADRNCRYADPQIDYIDLVSAASRVERYRYNAAREGQGWRVGTLFSAT
jgi:hypothetical protein